MVQIGTRFRSGRKIGSRAALERGGSGVALERGAAAAVAAAVEATPPAARGASRRA